MRCTSPQTQAMVDRTVQDANFLHAVELVGTAAAWAESLERGHKVGRNDLNMIQIPAEVAMAFIKHHAADAGDLGAACNRAIMALACWRGLDADKTGDLRGSGGAA